MLNSTQVPQNAIYYNDQFNGFINLTSVYDAPLFISKTHLLDADAFLQNNVIYLNSNGNVIKPNNADNSYLLVEPTTGVTFTAYVNAQVNELIGSDDLFLVNYTAAMLPIANIFVSANLT